MSDYTPFGPEWKKEMMKWRKSDLVDKLREQLTGEAGQGPASTPGLSVAGQDAVEDGTKNFGTGAIKAAIEDAIVEKSLKYMHVKEAIDDDDRNKRLDEIQELVSFLTAIDKIINWWQGIFSTPNGRNSRD